jgi:predicted transposase YdaD
MVWTLQIEVEDQIRKDEKIRLATKLKSNGMDIKTIHELTGLSANEIEKL